MEMEMRWQNIEKKVIYGIAAVILPRKDCLHLNFKLNPAAIGWLKYERVIDYAINWRRYEQNTSRSRDAKAAVWRSSMTRITFSDVIERETGVAFLNCLRLFGYLGGKNEFGNYFALFGSF